MSVGGRGGAGEHQSLNLREFQVLVSCIVSPVNWKFLRLCDFE